MMTKKHLPLDLKGQAVRADNMLEYNCKRNHLPELPKIEKWLEACKEAFDSPEKFLGGMYDWTLRQAELKAA